VRSRLVLRFDYSGADFPESYFHYKLGYLLSGVSALLKNGRDEKHVVLESYGPILDEKMVEVLDYFGITYEFIPPRSRVDEAQGEVVMSQRWDSFMASSQYYKTAPLGLKMKLLVKGSFSRNLRSTLFWNRSAFRNDLLNVRQSILDAIGPVGHSAAYGNEILLLERAGVSEKYDKQRNIGSGYHYGKSRRSLIGVESAVDKLRSLGLNISAYTPGDHNLTEQIKRFHQTNKIITIRGAELANIVWMKPGSKVIVIDPEKRDGRNESPAKELAAYLGVTYHAIHLNHGAFPELNDQLLTKITNLIYD